MRLKYFLTYNEALLIYGIFSKTYLPRVDLEPALTVTHARGYPRTKIVSSRLGGTLYECWFRIAPGFAAIKCVKLDRCRSGPRRLKLDVFNLCRSSDVSTVPNWRHAIFWRRWPHIVSAHIHALCRCLREAFWKDRETFGAFFKLLSARRIIRFKRLEVWLKEPFQTVSPS